jgi:glycosyltransferase involved in cell wall biosynthesis
MTYRTVAAIVPVYNRPELVLEALDSIASQTLPPTRLIVVDDGSTDDTAQRVGQWLKAADLAFDTQLLRQSNAGCGAARNRGVIEAAGCDLLAFLDSDDLWPTDYLQRMTAAFSNRDDAVAASCDRKVTFASSSRDYMLCARPLDGSATAELFAGYCPNPSSTVITAAAFDRVGRFDARWQFFEDQDLFLRLSLLGAWVYCARRTSRLSAGDVHRRRRPGEYDRSDEHGRGYLAAKAIVRAVPRRARPKRGDPGPSPAAPPQSDVA